MSAECPRIRYIHLLTMIIFMASRNIHCCLPEPKNQVSLRTFTFEASPSVNVSFGDRLELTCFVNATDNLVSLRLYSRMSYEFNTTCTVSPKSGTCTAIIEFVQPWDIGKYDCVKTYRDKSCFSKSLTIKEVVVKPNNTRTTEAFMKTTEASTKPTEVYTTTAVSTLSEILKVVSTSDAVKTSDKTTPASGNVLSTSAKYCVTLLFVVIARSFVH